jgi:dienelactone hydrolase
VSSASRDWRQPPSSDHEPCKILIKRGGFTDAARGGRVVPYKIYHPVEHGLSRLPVIIWSHGLGGTADGAAFLGRFVASHGYVVVNMQHAGTDSALWEGKPGHPWDVIRATPISREVTMNRFLDVPFVLDQLPGWAEENPEVGTLDLSRLGMSGHSFGAMTTQIMAGQLFPDADGVLHSFREDRFRAAIAYSPVPAHDDETGGGHGKDAIYGPIAIPALYMTGTEDISPLGGITAKQREEPFEHAGAGDQSLVVLEGGDHMVFAGSRGKLAENPRRARQEEIIKILSLAFWDAHLGGNGAAQAWLNGSGVAEFLGKDALCRHRP